jgi:hypothetical protein
VGMGVDGMVVSRLYGTALQGTVRAGGREGGNKKQQQSWGRQRAEFGGSTGQPCC